jgi:hypothetical protein
MTRRPAPVVSSERRREAAPTARRRGVTLAGAATMTMALTLVVADGAPVGAGVRRPAPTPPSAVTVDNPITGAAVPDAVYHGTSAPKAVVIGTGVASRAGPGPVTPISPSGVVLSI